ncbi:MAG: DUF2975 domain-containing protein [Novosphingobium sp.]
MTSIKRDPLLAVAKGILWFLMGIMALSAAACLLAAPAVFFMRDHIAAELLKDAPDLPLMQFIGLVMTACLLGAVLLALLFRVFQLLKQIVDTVGQGDPFVPDNARRLTRMAWLTLAVQFASLPIGGIALWIHNVAEGTEAGPFGGHTGTEFDGNGVLLVLILFILARVFRKGAEMRAELEGTV